MSYTQDKQKGYATMRRMERAYNSLSAEYAAQAIDALMRWKNGDDSYRYTFNWANNNATRTRCMAQECKQYAQFFLYGKVF